LRFSVLKAECFLVLQLRVRLKDSLFGKALQNTTKKVLLRYRNVGYTPKKKEASVENISLLTNILYASP
jgi:hypothetical protein